MGFAASFRFSVDPLELKPGAWLLVHVPDTLPPPVYAMLGHSIREHLKQNDREDVRVLIVNREFSISALSADDLASLGYVRLSDLPAGMPQ